MKATKKNTSASRIGKTIKEAAKTMVEITKGIPPKKHSSGFNQTKTVTPIKRKTVLSRPEQLTFEVGKQYREKFYKLAEKYGMGKAEYFKFILDAQ